MLEDLLRESKEFPHQEIGVRVASSMFAALAYRQPQHPSIHEWAERALSYTKASQDIDIRIWVLFIQVFLEVGLGNLDQAAFALDTLLRSTRSGKASPFAQITVKMAAAIYYQTTGYHEKCMKAVSDGLELSRTSGIHFCKPALLAHAILSSLNINDSQTARQLLEELASGVEKSELSGDLFLTRDRHIYHFMSAREALIRGDLGQALLHIDPALKFGMETGSPVIIGWTHALRALIKHSLGKNSEAIEELDRTSDIAHQMKSNLLEFNVLLSRAQFAFDEGNESSGLALLRKALTLGRDQRMLSTHLDQPSATASLCVKALEAGIEVEYVQETIQRRGLIPDKPPLHLGKAEGDVVDGVELIWKTTETNLYLNVAKNLVIRTWVNRS